VTADTPDTNIAHQGTEPPGLEQPTWGDYYERPFPVSSVRLRLAASRRGPPLRPILAGSSKARKIRQIGRFGMQ